jgi:hypothetical protein
MTKRVTKGQEWEVAIVAMLAKEGEGRSQFQQQQKSWPSLFLLVHGFPFVFEHIDKRNI